MCGGVVKKQRDLVELIENKCGKLGESNCRGNLPVLDPWHQTMMRACAGQAEQPHPNIVL